MATIQDIARQLGVSTSTVSRALMGAQGVSESTRNKVRQVAKQLNYSVNRNAQNLVMGGSRTIGFMIPDIADSVFAKTAYGVEEALRGTPFSLVYINVKRSADNVCHFLQTASENRYAGVFVTIDDWTDIVIDQIRAINIPVDSLRRITPDCIKKLVPFVDTNYVDGAEIYLRHLLSLGHREFGYIGDDTSVGNARKDAFLRIAQKHGLLYHIITSKPYYSAGVRASAGYDMTRKLLDEYKGTTAICASDDQIAIGVLQFLSENGHSVPRDISVLGYDDRNISDLFCIQLTTMHQPLTEIGEQAGHMMLQMIKNPDICPESIFVPSALVSRRTVGPVRNA